MRAQLKKMDVPREINNILREFQQQGQALTTEQALEVMQASLIALFCDKSMFTSELEGPLARAIH